MEQWRRWKGQDDIGFERGPFGRVFFKVRRHLNPDLAALS